jgi:methionyl-tRNA formyltransferase
MVAEGAWRVKARAQMGTARAHSEMTAIARCGRDSSGCYDPLLMPSLARLVFFGTPEFAVPTLQALVDAGRPPLLVVAQPARPAGRGRELREPAVVVWARERGLPVEQPEAVRAPEFLQRMRSLDPDVAVVAAFGQIFSTELLAIPRQGCLNVHASLLPRWRGAAPIQAALAAGEAKTGVTTMRMERGLDTGPILLQRELAIASSETALELTPRLATLGGELMVETLAALERGELVPRPQPEGATYAPRLEKGQARVDWSLPAATLFDRWRAWQPWPGLETFWRGESVKILEAAPRRSGAVQPGVTPGTVLATSPDAIAVACGAGALDLRSLRRPGRRSQNAGEFAAAARLAVGDRLG